MKGESKTKRKQQEERKKKIKNAENIIYETIDKNKSLHFSGHFC